jgi:hypothetical protein
MQVPEQQSISGPQMRPAMPKPNVRFVTWQAVNFAGIAFFLGVASVFWADPPSSDLGSYVANAAGSYFFAYPIFLLFMIAHLIYLITVIKSLIDRHDFRDAFFWSLTFGCWWAALYYDVVHH